MDRWMDGVKGDLCACQPTPGAEGEPMANESPSRTSLGNPTAFFGNAQWWEPRDGNGGGQR